jgi:hypothetical protein
MEKAKKLTSQQERWEFFMATLCKFKAEYGHCYVPAKYHDNPCLILSGSIKCTNERAKYLEQELGFNLLGEQTGLPLIKYPQERWERYLANLRDFKVRNGNCNVPKKYLEN